MSDQEQSTSGAPHDPNAVTFVGFVLSLAHTAAYHFGDVPDPDLFIRTGGDHRISNFLLWNLAYTEIHVCEVLWPDFSVADLEAALASFAARERRFGQTPEQRRGKAVEAAGSA